MSDERSGLSKYYFMWNSHPSQVAYIVAKLCAIKILTYPRRAKSLLERWRNSRAPSEVKGPFEQTNFRLHSLVSFLSNYNVQKITTLHVNIELKETKPFRLVKKTLFLSIYSHCEDL